MLQSNRFNTIVTRDTHDRLLRVQSNDQPIARGEPHRGAVVAIQSALAALNAGYMVGTGIDGYFGSRTFQAVEAFQRDYGLIADGMVGRQTINQLDALFSGEVVRPPHGVSIHVGVDRVDPAHYGSAMELPSCVNDANAMREIAEALGYDTLVLTNEDATTRNFLGFLRSCADSLFAGDTMLVSFSGHGSQVPNNSGDEEADLEDETMCFYDRMLIDDELYALLAELREGVRVHAAIDSCHSGTALKVVDVSKQQKDQYIADLQDALNKTLPYTVVAKPYKDETKSYTSSPNSSTDVKESSRDAKKSSKGAKKSSTNVKERHMGLSEAPAPTFKGESLEDFSPEDLISPIKGTAITDALDGERPTLIKAMPDKKRNKEIAELFADLYEGTSFGKAKFLDGKQVYGRKANELKDKDGNKIKDIYVDNTVLYDAVKDVVGSKKDVELACTVVSLSACHDAQTTPAGNPLSLFTFNLTRAWDSGSFLGSYSEFHSAIVNGSVPDATPQINTYGAGGSEARVYERPFAF